jgi:hypothetical protein
MKSLVQAVALLALSASASASELSLFSRARAIIDSHFEGADFWAYSKDVRVEVVKSYRQKVRAEYSLYDVKLENMGIDIEANFDAAIAEEEAINDSEDSSEQAAANLAFIDRFRKLTASFKDTHFGTAALHTLSPVSLGVYVSEADGRFVVTGLAPRIVALSTLVSGDPRFSQIAFGDELVSIDGKTPAEAIAELTPYISASSEGFARGRAATALTSRSFRFPEQGYAVLELKKPNGTSARFKMPWLGRQVTRADQARLFHDRGYTNSMPLRYSWNEQKQQWEIVDIELKLYEPGRSLVGIHDEKIFEDAATPGSLILRTGYVLREGRAIGVLQIFGFHVTTVARNGENLAFLQVIRDFVSELEEVHAPLILDLRANGGGIGNYPPQVMAMLTPPQTTYAGRTFAYRPTPLIRQLLDSYDEESAPSSEVLEGLDWESYKGLVTDAVARRAPITHAANEGDIVTDRGVGGYTGKLVALISPECISACDNMAMYIEQTSRGPIIGTHSNGTGAGFMSSAAISPDWRDNYQIMRARVPNYLFGRPGGEAGVRIFEDRAAELNMENRPTRATITYATTVRDVLSGDQGWLDVALNALALPQ